MRRLGQLLAVLGLGVGAVMGEAVFLPSHFHGLAWLVALGIAKLGFAGSLGLIAGGAVLQRIANREDERQRLAGPRG